MDKKTGTWDKIKGKTNEAVGDLRGDETQKLKGKAQQAKGELEHKTSDLERRVRGEHDV